MKPLLFVALVLTAASFVGCASPRATRITEHAALFAALPPIDQERIRQGLIDVGFREEHVYMALGRPSRTQPAPGGEVSARTWVYHNFVYGTSSAGAIAPTQTGARYDGRQLVSTPTRGGVSAVPRGRPTNVLDESGGATATLLVDLVDGVVTRIRLEP